MTSNAAGVNAAFASNKFFRAEEKTTSPGGISLGNGYVVLKPKGGEVGIVDVLNTMKWKNNGSNDEVPSIWATEFELKFGTTATNLVQLLTQGKNVYQVLKNKFLTGDNPNASLDTFLTMYASNRTGFAYNFPYLNTNAGLKKVTNNWGAEKSLLESIGSGGESSAGSKLDMVASVAGAATSFFTPKFGFEEVQSFQGTSQQSLTISFPLYNTIDIDSAFDHYSFVNLLTFQNLKTRTTMMSYIPPKIYTVDSFSLGGIYMAAAYISDLSIESIGTTRKMDIFKDFGSREVLIPEAYKITITFTDLVSQSSNVFAATMGAKKVDVISINKTLQEKYDKGAAITGKTLETAANLYGKAYDAISDASFNVAESFQPNLSKTEAREPLP
jgi:hypothetical protein